jgi:hypothetical protein
MLKLPRVLSLTAIPSSLLAAFSDDRSPSAIPLRRNQAAGRPSVEAAPRARALLRRAGARGDTIKSFVALGFGMTMLFVAACGGAASPVSDDPTAGSSGPASSSGSQGPTSANESPNGFSCSSHIIAGNGTCTNRECEGWGPRRDRGAVRPGALR